MIRFFIHTFGLDDGSGAWYLFWSGIFGDTTLFAAALGLYWHHTCHLHRCPRLAKHDYTIDGVTHKLCRHHHPGTKKHLTLTDVLAHHHAHRA